MAQTTFSGSFDHSLDGKGRVIIPASFREALGEDFTRTTDDNMIAEAAGAKVTAVETSRYNIKITTKDDILYAEFILSRRGER